MSNKLMHGTVTGRQGRFFVISCPDAPTHLQILHLVPWQMGKATVGDKVTLEYQSAPSYGLWNVVKVEAAVS